MQQLPKITVKMHKGKPHFRWYANGKPRYRKIKKPANEEQERIQLAAELMNPDSATTKRKSLAENLQDWNADLLADTTPKNADMLLKRVRRILNEAGITRTQQVTVSKVRTAIHRLRCTPRKQKKKPEEYPLLSEQSRKHYARAIKQFTRWLLNEEQIDKDPLRKWQLRAVVEERNPRDRLQPDEIKKLIAKTRNSGRVVEGYEGPLRAWLYTLAVHTGLRRKELAALTPESFDLEAKTLVVPAAYTKAKKMAVQPLNSGLVASLEPWLAEKQGPLFPDLEIKRTRKMMQIDLKEAGIPMKTDVGTRCFHSLRNTYISALHDAGHSPALVQRLARHSDVRLTMKYGKPRSDEAGAVESLEF